MLQRSILVLAMTMLAVPAVAQDGTNTWSDVSMSDLRSRVMVLDEAGAEWSGEPLRLDADGLALILASGQERHFPVAQIRRLETTRRDSLKNGTLIGAGVGALVGLMLTGVGEGTQAGWIAVITGYGTVIGVGVDFLLRGERQTTIYEASGTTFAERHGVGGRGPHTSRTLTATISW
tara:strand:- start:245 stop:775 length:531 start_codon:yes stop_codon:yes gene_type:complete